jgi:dTDP-L-rhamnose 4-epimerase
VYEDGLQSRDFISVHDVVQAFLLALEKPEANGQIFNVGSGRGTSILEIGKTLAKLLGKSIEPLVKNEARKNDVRHCIADNTKLKAIGWSSNVSFEEGMKELIAWGEQEEAIDRFAEAEAELKAKGIAK